MKRTPAEEAIYRRNKQLMYQRDSWKCRYCNRRDGLTPHHIKYQSHGGTDDLSNLLTLCLWCHDLVHAKKLIINVTQTGEGLLVKFWRK